MELVSIFSIGLIHPFPLFVSFANLLYRPQHYNEGSKATKDTLPEICFFPQFVVVFLAPQFEYKAKLQQVNNEMID
jgi:hypothetical protein